MTTIWVVLFSVLIPFCMTLMFEDKAQGTKRSVVHGAAIAAVSCLVAVAARLVLGDRVTGYEYLLVASLTAALGVLVLPVLRKETFEPMQVMRFVFLMCMICVVYSIVTYGQTLIHGDTATASLLTKSQLKHGQFFPEDWYYVNGDIWVFSLQLFVAPFVILMENQSLARMLGSALLVIVTAWSMYLHSRKAYRDDSWLLAVPLLFVFLAGERDMMLYQVAYTLQMVFLVVGAFWTFRIYEGNAAKRDYAILGGFIVMLVAGGVRDVAETVLPLWLTCMVLNYLNVRNREYLNWKQIWTEWIRLTLAVMVSAVVGLAVHIYLKRTLHVVNSAHNSLVLVSSLSDCIDNAFQYVINLFDCFGFRGGAQLISLDGIWSMCCVVMCCIVVFVVPVLQALKLKDEPGYVQFLFAFGVIHNLIMFVLAVFLEGKDESRYLLTSIFAWILVSARYIYVYWINQKHFEKIIWIGLFTVASVLGCAALGENSLGWEKKLDTKKAVVSELVEKGLTKGYGSFWDVYGFEIYSDFEIRFGGLEMYDDDFIAHFWLTDGDVFIPEEKNTFLLLSEEENERYVSLLEEKFEEPIDYFEIKGNHIYVYDYDIAEDMT